MNEAPASIDELISRHFDEALPPAEHQRLMEALNADRGARLSFAATARLHAGLEALAPALPPVRKSRLTRWSLAGAAAAAVVIAGGILFLNHRDGFQTSITLEDMDARPDGKPEKPKPPGLTKRVVKSPAAALTAGTEPVDVTQLLSRYYVNVSPHGLTVSQALVQLEEAIKFENVLKRPELDQLTFSAATSVDLESADPVVYTPRKAPLTVQDYIETCGLYRQVIQNPGSSIQNPPRIALTPPSMTGAPEVREFRVPEDFLSSRENEPPYPEGNAAAARLARSFGIRLVGDESATFSSNPPTVTVCAVPGKLDQLSLRMEQAFGNIAQQIFVSSKYLKLPRTLLPAGFDEESGMIMRDDDLQRFLDLVAKDHPAAIVAAPSVIVRAGQRAKLEVLREVVYQQTETANIGMSQGILPVLCGELIRVEGLVELGVLDGLEMPGEFKALGLSNQGGAPRPEYFKTEYELWLPDRSTGLFVVDSPQVEGFVTLVCLTPTMVDAAGEPLKKTPSNDVPAGIPVAGKSGFLLSPFARDREGIDVTRIPSGTHVKCPYTGKMLRVP